MKFRLLPLAGMFATMAGTVLDADAQDRLVRPMIFRTSSVFEGSMPALAGATAWLNSEPVMPEALRGKVVVIDFWTYTCINWQRSQPYVRSWHEKYKDEGQVVIGVHTPEFEFEKIADNIRPALRRFRVDYPVAVDSGFMVWNAFNNRAWPAVYVIDASGRIRYQHYGEGEYERTEAVIRQLLREAGYPGTGNAAVRVDPKGSEVGADWANLRSPESYLGLEKAVGFSSPGGAGENKRRTYAVPGSLRLNQWALAGDWTMRSGEVALEKAGGRIVYRFHARDVHLVMGTPSRDAPVRFRVLLDGRPPGSARGADVDERGYGTATEQRLYQLIRQRTPIAERVFEIEFLDPGAEAYAFTFG
jgi:thiol-disulfide isomerase/thioredoxin